MIEINHLGTSQYSISCKNVVQIELDATVHSISLLTVLSLIKSLRLAIFDFALYNHIILEIPKQMSLQRLFRIRVPSGSI